MTRLAALAGPRRQLLPVPRVHLLDLAVDAVADGTQVLERPPHPVPTLATDVVPHGMGTFVAVDGNVVEPVLRGLTVHVEYPAHAYAASTAASPWRRMPTASATSASLAIIGGEMRATFP